MAKKSGDYIVYVGTNRIFVGPTKGLEGGLLKDAKTSGLRKRLGAKSSSTCSPSSKREQLDVLTIEQT